MHLDRPADRRELIENGEDPADRADPEGRLQSAWCGPWNSPRDDYDNREMWRRVLAAHTQPLADAAD